MEDAIFPSLDNPLISPDSESDNFDIELEAEDLIEEEGELRQALDEFKATVIDADVTGGDIESNAYQAEVVGEEAVGGQTPTPDQNVTEALQKALGISSEDGESIRTTMKLEWRDHHPWQLNPESSEDYQARCEFNDE